MITLNSWKRKTLQSTETSFQSIIFTTQKASSNLVMHVNNALIIK